MHRTVSPDPLQQSCDLAGYGCEDPLLMSKGVAANRTGVADMPGQNEPWASLRAWPSARGNGAAATAERCPPDGVLSKEGARLALATCFHGAHRSEEHTSELQSQSNLVCRLLLEKKKKRQ